MYLRIYHKAQAYQKEAAKVAAIYEHVFKNNPIVVALMYLLLVKILGFNFPELHLDVRMVCRKISEACKILQSLLRPAAIDEVARRLRDEWNHDAHQSTGDELNACIVSVLVIRSPYHDCTH
jgi:hypothetical protein